MDGLTRAAKITENQQWKDSVIDPQPNCFHQRSMSVIELQPVKKLLMQMIMRVWKMTYPVVPLLSIRDP